MTPISDPENYFQEHMLETEKCSEGRERENKSSENRNGSWKYCDSTLHFLFGHLHGVCLNVEKLPKKD